MTKLIGKTFLVLLILIFGVWFWKNRPKNTVTITKEEFKTYKSINCPEVTNIEDKELQSEFNSKIEDYISGTFGDINWSNAITTEATPTGTDVNWLTVSCIPILIDGKISSMEVNISSYGAGAAHPNNYSSIVKLKEQTLQSLFKPNTDYLKIITNVSRRLLNKRDRSIPSWIIEGTSGENSFSNFLVEKDGLRIVFSDYQVAPHSEGIIEILIPKAELGKNYLY